MFRLNDTAGSSVAADAAFSSEQLCPSRNTTNLEVPINTFFPGSGGTMDNYRVEVWQAATIGQDLCRKC